MTHPLDCPVGRFCTGGNAVPELCPAGTFGPNLNAVGQDNCTICTPGQYCDVDGLDAPSGNCSAGFYCTGGAVVSVPTEHLVSGFDNFSVLSYDIASGSDIMPCRY